MSSWSRVGRQLARGLHALFHRRAADREIADEVAHYLAEATAAHEARGLSPAEAARAARRELGNELNVREEVRGYGWENVLETFFADLRYAARRLRRSPGFTAVAVVTLALGIGATTAIFSVIHPILLEPLPYPGARRIAVIWEVARDGSRIDGTFGMYRALSRRARSLDSIAVVKRWRPALSGGDEPERLEGQRVSAAYFRVLGVAPALGRGFQPSEDRMGGPDVVILGDAFWRRRFAGDPSILGRPVTLDDTPYVVVGVMPPGFENVLAPDAQLWAPLQYDMSQGRAWGHHLHTLARLRAGVGREPARRELDAIGEAVLAELRPETYGSEVRFQVASLHDEVTRPVRPALLAVLGAVVLVLLIAAVNVTNLLLARGARRRGELALRAALGAGHRRLLRQLLTESLLLAALGGAAGLGLAVAGVHALTAFAPPGLPRLDAVRVDGVVLVFGVVLTTLVGLGCGLAPARQAARSDPHRYLEEDRLRAGGGRRGARGALVVAEVALTLVLLVGSGLLLRSLERLLTVDPGFDAAHLLTMQIQTTGHRFEDGGATRRFFERALEAVRGLPGVTSAALTSQLPLSGDSDLYGVHFDPSAAADPGEPEEVHGTYRYAVSPGYFETLGIPLRRGRLLDRHDRADAPRVVVISEALAARRLPGLDPIGRRLRIGVGPLYTVVGVVGEVHQASLALEATDAVYTTEAQWRFADDAMSLVVRTEGEAAVLAPAVRRAIWSVDPDQPIARVATMDGLVAASTAERRFALALFEAFALAALALAATGIYGVLSGTVAERTREIGVRSALGATRREILSLVLRQGMTLTGLGVVLGAAGAVAASRALATMLFDLSPLDPATYLGVVALLAAVALLACALPAWRAAQIDPARTLRTE